MSTDDEFRTCPNALRSILSNEGIANPPPIKDNVCWFDLYYSLLIVQSSLFTRRTSLFPGGILSYVPVTPRKCTTTTTAAAVANLAISPCAKQLSAMVCMIAFKVFISTFSQSSSNKRKAMRLRVTFEDDKSQVSNDTVQNTNQLLPITTISDISVC